MLTLLDHGWLARLPEHDGYVEGVFIGAEWRTRREEFTFAREQAVGSTLCDVATGYNPSIHLFALIMAKAGWVVDAVDINKGVHDLPTHPSITYQVADARALPFPEASFDYVTCISVLEHMDPIEQRQSAAEMVRVARRRVLVTADHFADLPGLFGFDVPATEPDRSLDPPVYYAIVEKDA